MHATTIRRPSCLAAGSLSGLALLAGCTGTPQATHMATRSASVETWHAMRLDAATNNGGIEVERAVGINAAIEARFRMQSADRAQRAAISALREADGTLTVRPAWPDGRRLDGEGASLRITLPEARGVRLDTSNGPITIRGLSGHAHLDTSNGTVRAEDHDGSLFVDTSNARVEARRINGPVEVDTSNGSVLVEHAYYGVEIESSNASVVVEQAAGPITVDTSNASATVRLAPDAAGPVRIDTSNGAIDLTVGPGFRGTLRFATSNANTYIDAPNASWSADGKHSGTVRFSAPGTLGEPSLATTSNGSITIRQLGGNPAR